jgi:hypothetical protein
MIPDCLVTVKGAVSKKDLIPTLTHLAFTGTHVHGFNGHLHICAPSPEFKSLPSITVPALRLLPILDSIADDTIRFSVKEGVLRVSAGRLRASIPTGKIEDFPMNDAPPKGKALKAALLPMLAKVRPFISEDASKAWSQTVRIEEDFAYATNNVAIIAHPVPKQLRAVLKGVLLPVFIIDELLRIGIEPVSIAWDAGSTVSFWYESGAWIRCALPALEWPNAKTTLKIVHDGQKRKLKRIPPHLAEAVAQLRPLCPDATMPVIELNDALVLTGAAITTGALVLECATHADFTAAPRVPWSGDDGVYGMLVGVVSR